MNYIFLVRFALLQYFFLIKIYCITRNSKDHLARKDEKKMLHYSLFFMIFVFASPLYFTQHCLLQKTFTLFVLSLINYYIFM